MDQETRNINYLSRQFLSAPEMQIGNVLHVRCRHCVAAYRAGARPRAPEIIPCEHRLLQKHLLSCSYVDFGKIGGGRAVQSYGLPPPAQAIAPARAAPQYAQFTTIREGTTAAPEMIALDDPDVSLMVATHIFGRGSGTGGNPPNSSSAHPQTSRAPQGQQRMYNSTTNAGSASLRIGEQTIAPHPQSAVTREQLMPSLVPAAIRSPPQQSPQAQLSSTDGAAVHNEFPPRIDQQVNSGSPIGVSNSQSSVLRFSAMLMPSSLAHEPISNNGQEQNVAGNLGPQQRLPAVGDGSGLLRQQQQTRHAPAFNLAPGVNEAIPTDPAVSQATQTVDVSGLQARAAVQSVTQPQQSRTTGAAQDVRASVPSELDSVAAMPLPQSDQVMNIPTRGSSWGEFLNFNKDKEKFQVQYLFKSGLVNNKRFSLEGAAPGRAETADEGQPGPLKIVGHEQPVYTRVLVNGWLDHELSPHSVGCFIVNGTSPFELERVQWTEENSAAELAKQIRDVLIRLQARQNRHVVSCCLGEIGQRGRARRMLSLRFPTILFPRCFAHLINRLMRDFFAAKLADGTTLVRNSILGACELRTTVSHDEAISSLASKLCEEFYGQDLKVQMIEDMRFDSIFECITDLLKYESALKRLAEEASKHHTQTWRLSTLKVDTENFWSELKEVARIAKPITEAALLFEQDGNTYAHAFHSILKMYQEYQQMKYTTLSKKLEQYWREEEQPLFLLTYLINPVTVRFFDQLPVHPITSVQNMCETAVFYYRRFLGPKSTENLVMEVFKWHQRFVRGAESTKGIEGLTFWKYMSGLYPSLSKLAVFLLSCNVQASSCKRIFKDHARSVGRYRSSMDKLPRKSSAVAARLFTVLKEGSAELPRVRMRNNSDNSTGQEQQFCLLTRVHSSDESKMPTTPRSHGEKTGNAPQNENIANPENNLTGNETVGMPGVERSVEKQSTPIAPQELSNRSTPAANESGDKEGFFDVGSAREGGLIQKSSPAALQKRSSARESGLGNGGSASANTVVRRKLSKAESLDRRLKAAGFGVARAGSDEVLPADHSKQTTGVEQAEQENEAEQATEAEQTKQAEQTKHAQTAEQGEQAEPAAQARDGRKTQLTQPSNKDVQAKREKETDGQMTQHMEQLNEGDPSEQTGEDAQQNREQEEHADEAAKEELLEVGQKRKAFETEQVASGKSRRKSSVTYRRTFTQSKPTPPEEPIEPPSPAESSGSSSRVVSTTVIDLTLSPEHSEDADMDGKTPRNREREAKEELQEQKSPLLDEMDEEMVQEDNKPLERLFSKRRKFVDSSKTDLQNDSAGKSIVQEEGDREADERAAATTPGDKRKQAWSRGMKKEVLEVNRADVLGKQSSAAPIPTTTGEEEETEEVLEEGELDEVVLGEGTLEQTVLDSGTAPTANQRKEAGEASTNSGGGNDGGSKKPSSPPPEGELDEIVLGEGTLEQTILDSGTAPPANQQKEAGQAKSSSGGGDDGFALTKAGNEAAGGLGKAAKDPPRGDSSLLDKDGHSLNQQGRKEATKASPREPEGHIQSSESREYGPLVPPWESKAPVESASEKTPVESPAQGGERAQKTRDDGVAQESPTLGVQVGGGETDITKSGLNETSQVLPTKAGPSVGESETARKGEESAANAAKEPLSGPSNAHIEVSENVPEQNRNEEKSVDAADTSVTLTEKTNSVSEEDTQAGVQDEKINSVPESTPMESAPEERSAVPEHSQMELDTNLIDATDGSDVEMEAPGFVHRAFVARTQPPTVAPADPFAAAHRLEAAVLLINDEQADGIGPNSLVSGDDAVMLLDFSLNPPEERLAGLRTRKTELMALLPSKRLPTLLGVKGAQ